MNNKIGVAIITCNRQDFFEQCVKSVPDGIDVVVINDGIPYKREAYPSNVKEVIQHVNNKSVGVSKNEALRYLKQKDCDHLFLMEDDIFIKNPKVFETYIKTASKSGIWHLNYGGHGNYNRNLHTNQVNVKQVIDYGDITVDFYQNILGAFSYYHKGVIRAAGYMDERYINAMEHVDHTYNIIKLGLHSPFWFFADIHNSWEYIQDIKANFEGSEIRKDLVVWQKNFNNACALFEHKHGVAPTRVPPTNEENTLNLLKEIRKNYAREL